MRSSASASVAGAGDGHDHARRCTGRSSCGRRRPSSPSTSSVGRIGKSTTSRPAATQARAVVGHALALGRARRRALEQHLAGTGEGGDEVDVAVGVAVLGEALPQPHHPLDAQVVAQPLLDLLARQCPGCGWGAAGTARW